MKRKHFMLLTVVLMMASVALGDTVNGGKLDDFNILLKGGNELVEGGGSGWRDPESQRQWFLYNEDTTQPNPWWNQWFYDDPPTWDRMKHIEYTILVDPLLTDSEPLKPNITVGVALNWSTMKYPETGPDGPPPMPDAEWAIERYIVFYEDWLEPGKPYQVTGEYDILDFNPEWVSIDVWAEAWDVDEAGNVISLPVQITGEVYHECIIPEPATLSLLAFGGLALLRRRKI